MLERPLILHSLFRPKSGSMLLYSRKKVRYRRDGYCWKKRKDGKTTREDHMKLKVQGMEVSESAIDRAELTFGGKVPCMQKRFSHISSSFCHKNRNDNFS